MRFLPMGFAIAPSMTSGPLRRLFAGALITDASFIIGHREGGRFDVNAVVWAAPAQFLGWVGGTVVGAMGATSIGETTRWGIDVLFPVFYLSLLLPELFPGRKLPRNLRPIIVAVLAGAITLVLTPIAPPGVPVLAAAAAALIGLRAPRHRVAELDTGDHA
jgi:predicted branched-subunit amino acid permease